MVVVPFASHGDADLDHELGVRVVDNYAQGDPVHALTTPADEESYPDDIAAIVDFDRPAPGEQGLVLFFTGLSGSGKSTLARALTDRILEQGERTVTSLDGDVVRRNLSAGPHLLQGRPGDQHPPDRLGRRRDRPARRRRGRQPDRPLRRDPPAGPGRWSRRPAATSS